MSKKAAVKARAKRRRFLKSVVKDLKTSQEKNTDVMRKLQYYKNQLKRP